MKDKDQEMLAEAYENMYLKPIEEKKKTTKVNKQTGHTEISNIMTPQEALEELKMLYNKPIKTKSDPSFRDKQTSSVTFYDLFRDVLAVYNPTNKLLVINKKVLNKKPPVMTHNYPSGMYQPTS